MVFDLHIQRDWNQGIRREAQSLQVNESDSCPCLESANAQAKECTQYTYSVNVTCITNRNELYYGVSMTQVCARVRDIFSLANVAQGGGASGCAMGLSYACHQQTQELWNSGIVYYFFRHLSLNRNWFSDSRHNY